MGTKPKPCYFRRQDFGSELRLDADELFYLHPAQGVALMVSLSWVPLLTPPDAELSLPKACLRGIYLGG